MSNLWMNIAGIASLVLLIYTTIMLIYIAYRLYRRMITSKQKRAKRQEKRANITKRKEDFLRNSLIQRENISDENDPNVIEIISPIEINSKSYETEPFNVESIEKLENKTNQEKTEKKDDFNDIKIKDYDIEKKTGSTETLKGSQSGTRFGPINNTEKELKPESNYGVYSPNSFRSLEFVEKDIESPKAVDSEETVNKIQTKGTDEDDIEVNIEDDVDVIEDEDIEDIEDNEFTLTLCTNSNEL